jgi:hypothetical protein
MSYEPQPFSVTQLKRSLHIHLFLTDHLLCCWSAIICRIRSFQPHAITSGVTSLNYIAGSVIRNCDPSKITVLGSQTTSGAAAMGIVKHPSSKIFFIGDVNGIEQVPQPFIANLKNWLFQ